MSGLAGPGEPVVATWRVVPLSVLVADLTRASVVGRARVVAVDGRGGSGKSTLADRIAAVVPGAVVVHTDDLAWHHDFFAWTDLLVDGVLRPLRAGHPVNFTPPAWTARGRGGAIGVPADTSLLVVEGCGSGRAELAPWLEAAAFWDEWMAVEVPFYRADRPWDRADVIVGGSNQLPHDPTTEVLLAPPFAAAGRRGAGAGRPT